MKKMFTVLLGGLSLAACSGADDAASDSTATPEAGAEDATDAAPASADDLVAAVDGMTGVPECDNYFEQVMACVSDKVPEAQRDMMLQALEQSKEQWAAVTDKTELAASCTAAMDQAKSTYAAMGCTF